MKFSHEVSLKIRTAIKVKLAELGNDVYEELPDYIMVMVANDKSQEQMTEDLTLFLGDNADPFSSWLHGLLVRLQAIAFDSTGDSRGRAEALKPAGSGSSAPHSESEEHYHDTEYDYEDDYSDGEYSDRGTSDTAHTEGDAANVVYSDADGSDVSGSQHSERSASELSEGEISDEASDSERIKHKRKKVSFVARQNESDVHQPNSNNKDAVNADSSSHLGDSVNKPDIDKSDSVDIINEQGDMKSKTRRIRVRSRKVVKNVESCNELVSQESASPEKSAAVVDEGKDGDKHSSDSETETRIVSFTIKSRTRKLEPAAFELADTEKENSTSHLSTQITSSSTSLPLSNPIISCSSEELELNASRVSPGSNSPHSPHSCSSEALVGSVEKEQADSISQMPTAVDQLLQSPQDYVSESTDQSLPSHVLQSSYQISKSQDQAPQFSDLPKECKEGLKESAVDNQVKTASMGDLEEPRQSPAREKSGDRVHESESDNESDDTSSASKTLNRDSKLEFDRPAGASDINSSCATMENEAVTSAPSGRKLNETDEVPKQKDKSSRTRSHKKSKQKMGNTDTLEGVKSRISRPSVEAETDKASDQEQNVDFKRRENKSYKAEQELHQSKRDSDCVPKPALLHGAGDKTQEVSKICQDRYESKDVAEHNNSDSEDETIKQDEGSKTAVTGPTEKSGGESGQNSDNIDEECVGESKTDNGQNSDIIDEECVGESKTDNQPQTRIIKIKRKSEFEVNNTNNNDNSNASAVLDCKAGHLTFSDKEAEDRHKDKDDESRKHHSEEWKVADKRKLDSEGQEVRKIRVKARKIDPRMIKDPPVTYTSYADVMQAKASSPVVKSAGTSRGASPREVDRKLDMVIKHEMDVKKDGAEKAHVAEKKLDSGTRVIRVQPYRPKADAAGGKAAEHSPTTSGTAAEEQDETSAEKNDNRLSEKSSIRALKPDNEAHNSKPKGQDSAVAGKTTSIGTFRRPAKRQHEVVVVESDSDSSEDQPPKIKNAKESGRFVRLDPESLKAIELWSKQGPTSVRDLARTDREENAPSRCQQSARRAAEPGSQSQSQSDSQSESGSESSESNERWSRRRKGERELTEANTRVARREQPQFSQGQGSAVRRPTRTEPRPLTELEPRRRLYDRSGREVYDHGVIGRRLAGRVASSPSRSTEEQRAGRGERGFGGRNFGRFYPVENRGGPQSRQNRSYVDINARANSRSTEGDRRTGRSEEDRRASDERRPQFRLTSSERPRDREVRGGARSPPRPWREAGHDNKVKGNSGTSETTSPSNRRLDHPLSPTYPRSDRLPSPNNKKSGGLVSPSNKRSGGLVSPSNKWSGGLVSPSDKRSGGLVSPSNKRSGGSVSPSNKRSGGLVSPSNKRSGGLVSPSNRRVDRRPSPAKRRSDLSQQSSDQSSDSKESSSQDSLGHPRSGYPASPDNHRTGRQISPSHQKTNRLSSPINRRSDRLPSPNNRRSNRSPSPSSQRSNQRQSPRKLSPSRERGRQISPGSRRPERQISPAGNHGSYRPLSSDTRRSGHSRVDVPRRSRDRILPTDVVDLREKLKQKVQLNRT